MGMQWDIKNPWDMTRINQRTSRFKRDDTGKKNLSFLETKIKDPGKNINLLEK